MRYIIHGAGAVGSLTGGRLAESGAEVALIARAAHAEAINERGLRIRSQEGERRVSGLLAVTTPQQIAPREDDLILLTVKLFQSTPRVLANYQRRFPWLLIDEYQDTNRSQYLLMKLLAGQSANLCAVGDEDQSIYKWRGADISNILNFEKHFPNTRTIRLEQNYRSTQTILDVAGAVVSHNLEQVIRLADRVTVLRRGAHIGTRVTSQTDKNEIVSMITGLQAADAADIA